MKQLLYCCCFLFCLSIIKPSAVLAQQKEKDSIAPHHLLIIAFQPEYYLSDAEQDIIKQNKRTPNEYRAYFRNSLDLKITAQLETLLPCTSLMQDSSKSARIDLEHFYGSAAMTYQQSKELKKDKTKPEKISKEIKDQHQAPQYMINKGDAKYMNASVEDTSFLKNLANKYNSDLILSINQFEIKTNYNSCIDIANKIYKRELFIHYTLMDIRGNILSGNVETAFFPSNSNRDSEIAERVFPVIASQLKEHLASFLSDNPR